MPQHDLLLALPAVALIAAACSGGGGDGGDSETSTPVGVERPEVVAGVDLSKHSVPLEEIHFDTFAGGSIPLSEASELVIERLRDAIPPLDSPKYDPAEGGDWLDGSDLILGYASPQGQAYAYPFKILNFHEIVNDKLDGVPVLISYCPLCRSGVVYDRHLEGRLLSFGNTSALFESDLVMFDRQTNSYWWQVAGEAIVGTLTGQRLEALPSITTTWEEWKKVHPDTLIISRDTGFARPYEFDRFLGFEDRINSGGFPFPVSDAVRDGRLAPADEVLGVTLNGESRAYPLRLLGDAAANDTLGDRRIVVFSRAQGPSGAAFSASLGERDLTFGYQDGAYLDEETRSEWDLSGEAVSGTLKGERLEALPSRFTFWFAYVAAFPETDVYTP